MQEKEKRPGSSVPGRAFLIVADDQVSGMNDRSTTFGKKTFFR